MKSSKKKKSTKKNPGEYVKKQLAMAEAKTKPKAEGESARGSEGGSSGSGSGSCSSSGSGSGSSSSAESGTWCASSDDDGTVKEQAAEVAEHAVEVGLKLTEEEMEAALRIDQDEGRESYKKGGYHPVRIGDAFKESRYVVYSKVGWGHFSTVWKAKDTKTGHFVALKIVRSAWQYTEAARDEIKFLERLASEDVKHECCCMHLLDHFHHFGPNGVHECMVFELLGSNLLDLIKLYHYRGIPIKIVKYITKQVLIALDFIHRVCGVIHTDLKPENVLLGRLITPELYRPKTPSSDGAAGAEASAATTTPSGEEIPPFEDLYRSYLADFGNANWKTHHFTDDIQTRQYRSPEVILGAQWSTQVDMWSLACMVFELLTGEYLFEPKSGKTFTKEDDHLCQMMELLGPMPNTLLMGKHTSKFFNKRGEMLHIAKSDMRMWPLKPVLLEKYRFPEKDAEEISEFLLPMLELEPLKRASAQAMLKHKWLADV